MYYLRKICCVCLKSDKMLIKATNLNQSIISFYFHNVIGNQRDPKLENDFHFCVPCFKTLKFYHIFSNQCKKNNTTLKSYITELTNVTTENLGLFNITVNITDIDPQKKIKINQTIKTKPNINLSNNDLKLSDIIESNVITNSESKEKKNFSKNTTDVNGEIGMHIKEEIDDDDEPQEMIVDDNFSFENGAQLEYEEVSYDEDLFVDLNILQTSTEPVRVTAPKLTTPLQNYSTSKSSSTKNSATCTICFKKFQNRSHLETHLLTHSDTRPFACDLCDKRFRQRAHLRTHKMIHFDLKPYSCPICSKSFRQKAHLNAHILLHSDTKLFRCDICEKFYRSQANLRFHRSTQHRDVLLRGMRANM